MYDLQSFGLIYLTQYGCAKSAASPFTHIIIPHHKKRKKFFLLKKSHHPITLVPMGRPTNPNKTHTEAKGVW